MSSYTITANVRMAINNSMLVHDAWSSGNYDNAYGNAFNEPKHFIERAPYTLGYFATFEDHEVPGAHRPQVIELRRDFDPALHAVGIVTSREITPDDEKLIRIARGMVAVEKSSGGMNHREYQVETIANILHLSRSLDVQTLIDEAVALFVGTGGKLRHDINNPPSLD